MKKLAIISLLVACLASTLRAGTSPVNERLAGSYAWTVPGSAWTLLLTASGDYSISARSDSAKSTQQIESGRWLVEGFTLVLDSKQTPVSGGEYRRLHVLQKKSGQMMLVSAVRSEDYIGQPFGSDVLFDYVFLRIGDAPKKGANQSSQPTPVNRRG